MEFKKHGRCLILNQDYTPLHTISWQDAICDMIIGKDIPGEGVRIIKYYENDVVMSAGGEPFPIPAVAVTNRYVKRKRSMALKKGKLLIRDNKKCQYCGKSLPSSEATIDHVIPQSHFANRKDAHTWDNVVVACFPCNKRKDDRTPQQANMKLLTKPYEPTLQEFNNRLNPYMQIPDEWKDYVKH